MRVAAVSVGVLWGKRHREQRPEQLPVTQIGVLITELASGELRFEDRFVLEGRELTGAPDRLAELDLPLVTFNGLRFDWVALDALAGAGGLIERTIDIYSALLPSVAELVEAEGVGAFPTRGEYGVLHPHRVAETNLGRIPGGGEDPLGEAELAVELWHHLLGSGRVVAAGQTHTLAAKELAMLAGERPAIANETAWRKMLSERPAPDPYRRRTRHPVTFPRIDQRYV